MAEVARRVELGFEGGQVIAVRIVQAELDALRKALGGDGWHLLKTEDEDVDVNLGDLIFLRTAGDGQKVGF